MYRFDVPSTIAEKRLLFRAASRSMARISGMSCGRRAAAKSVRHQLFGHP
jgi:hypothetical protein